MMKLSPPAFSLKKSVQGVLHFSASGRLLAQVTSRAVIWDVSARKEIASIKAISNEHFVAFHEESQRIAIKSSNGEFAFVDLPTGRTISETGKFREFVMGCQPWFSESGDRVLDGGSGGHLTVWDVATAKPSRQWDLGATAVNDIAFSQARNLFACLHSPAGGCRIALIDGDLAANAPRMLAASDFGIDAGLWWEADRVVFSPCGTRLALIAKTQARENFSRLYVLAWEESRLVYSVDVGGDANGWAASLSWSANNELAVVYHENPWRKGMSTPEYEAVSASRIWDSVEILDAETGRQIQHTYLSGVNRAAFRPASEGLALNCTRIAGVYLPSYRSVPDFAKGKLTSSSQT